MVSLRFGEESVFPRKKAFGTLCLYCNNLPSTEFIIAQKFNSMILFVLALLLNKDALGAYIYQSGAFFGTSFLFNIAP